MTVIPHVEVIRFHTRIPVVAPGRITDGLIDTLKTRPTVHVVVHSNDPAELTESACSALARLANAGIPVLSQSVLLKGVNDEASVREAWFSKLIRNRVKS